MITPNECLKLEYPESMFLFFFQTLALFSLDWPQNHYVQKACFNENTKQNKLECGLSTSHGNREEVHEII